MVPCCVHQKGKSISNSVGVCQHDAERWSARLSPVNLSNIINIPIALSLLNCDPGKWLPYFPHRDSLIPLLCPTYRKCVSGTQLAVNYRQFKFDLTYRGTGVFAVAQLAIFRRLRNVHFHVLDALIEVIVVL